MGGRAGLNVFVIDNSYSAAYRYDHPGVGGQEGGKTHLEQEKLIAKRLIDQLTPGGESVAIITAARPATAIIAKPGYDLNDAKAAVDRIEQSYAATDLAGTLHLADEVAKDDEQKDASKSLYLLTDGTVGAWQGAQSDAIRQSGEALARQYRVTHFNMTEGRPQWNQAVADVNPSTNLVTTKFRSQITFAGQGFGAAPDAAVQWSIDGAPVGRSPTVKLDPNPKRQPSGRLAVEPAQLRSGGPHVFSVTVGDDGDPLPADNTRHRVIDVAAEMKVLIVDGNRGNTDLESSGTFLQLALAPPAENAAGAAGPRTNSYVSADLISDINLNGQSLTPYRAVVLAGVGQITPDEANALQRYVTDGGTLMVFMGEPVTEENYNSVMLPRKLMPGPLVNLVEAPDNGTGFNFSFDPKDLHPFLKIFNQSNTGLDTANVYTYWRVDPQPDLHAERVLDYKPAKDKNGRTPPADRKDPAITHHLLGQGHVIFFSTTAGPGKSDKPWTTLPAKLAYVQLMHEILAGGVRPDDYWMNLSVGQRLEIPPNVPIKGTPELKDEQDVPVALESVSDEDPATHQKKPAVYRSGPLSKPGLYKLNLGTQALRVAVNTPAEEADVRTIGNEQVRKALGDIDMTLAGDDVPSESALDVDRLDWAGWVLLAVLLLLGVECYMAMRFGHYRRPGAGHYDAGIEPAPAAA